MRYYRMHGWRVRSSVPLGGASIEAPGKVDLEVVVGNARTVSYQPPSGQVLASVERGGQLGMVLVSGGAEHLLRFPALLDVELDTGAERITCYPQPGLDRAMIGTLVAGSGLSFALSLRGCRVLHASGVELPSGLAVAFAGPSGTGKTTAAGLACAAGARLVSDDVLRVDSSGSRCFRGSTTLRVREAAADLASLLPAAVPSMTPDGRHAVAPLPTAEDQLPLAGIVVPRPRRDIDEVIVTPLSEADAVIAVLRAARATGWSGDDPVTRQFLDAISLARSTTVAVADIPWGPPFEPRHGHQLLRALEVLTRGASPAVAGR